MKRLKISDFKELNQFDKIIVTGPPRSGTTITGLILAHELKYKFIDESFYDSNNSKKFMWFLTYVNRKIVLHTTAFLKDLHTISDLINARNYAVVIVRRSIKDVLESFENSKNFKKGLSTSSGIFTAIDEEAQAIIRKKYNSESKDSIPKLIYEFFDSTSFKFNNLFEVNYDDLSKHKFFVKKEERRKNFVHLKQVKVDDPYYLSTKKGVMVL